MFNCSYMCFKLTTKLLVDFIKYQKCNYFKREKKSLKDNIKSFFDFLSQVELRSDLLVFNK